MFVPPDALSVGPLVVEQIDWLVDRTDQSLVPNPTRLDQPVSRLSSRVISSGHNVGYWRWEGEENDHADLRISLSGMQSGL
jgi:hypothetical protein